MTRKKPPSKKKPIEKRVATLELQVADLRTRLERLELADMERIGDEQIAHGQFIPARQALEFLRRKYNIPRPKSGRTQKSNPALSFHELSASEAKRFQIGEISS
jgi:hypothetical protein